MDAKELKIGNIVHFRRQPNDPEEDEILYIISNIRTDKVRIFRFGEHPSTEFYITVDIGDVSPVQITEEWLFKFGLSKMEETEYTTDTYIRNGVKLWNKNGDFSVLIYEHSGVEIKFVHHLQNLYFELKREEL